MTQLVKNLTAMQETQVQSLGQEDPLEKEIETHSSILAWRIPWTEEPGRYSPWGCKESDTTEQHFIINHLPVMLGFFFFFFLILGLESTILFVFPVFVFFPAFVC